MKREKRMTKRERRAADPSRPAANEARHIHCIACGRHLEPSEFEGLSPRAVQLSCQHNSQFAACTECQVTASYLITEHDRTGQPVAAAQAWH